MPEVPIFDCVTHPSLDGSWLHPCGAGRNTFEELAGAMKAAHVPWALAIAMGSTDGYDVHEYPSACSRADVPLIPIGYLSLTECADEHELRARLSRLRELGYRGIKIHPRRDRIDFRHPLLAPAICEADRIGMFTLLCTYFYSADPACLGCHPESLRELLCRAADAKLILLHAGGVRLLEVTEMTRPFRRVLLDLSFTLCEYAGSSIDLDLRFVLERCQSRVCLGSDAPEFSPMQMRTRFDELTDRLSVDTRERIAFRNLLAFTEVPA